MELKLSDNDIKIIKEKTTKLIIIFEGSDGCGKTTLMNTIAEILRSSGLKVGIINSPIHNEYKTYIRDELAKENPNQNNLDKPFFTDKMEFLLDLIHNNLPEYIDSDCDVILMDRFITSFRLYHFSLGNSILADINNDELKSKYPDICILEDMLRYTTYRTRNLFSFNEVFVNTSLTVANTRLQLRNEKRESYDTTYNLIDKHDQFIKYYAQLTTTNKLPNIIDGKYFIANNNGVNYFYIENNLNIEDSYIYILKLLGNIIDTLFVNYR